MSKKTKKRPDSLKIPAFILYAATFLAFISRKLLTRFAAHLFTTPIRYKMPKREYEMDSQSEQFVFDVKSIDKKIRVYRYGSGPKKILLVHGWSGRGTQLVKIADAFKNEGYQILSFDAPAHGKSPGSTSIMTEFIATILELEQKYGPFEAAVGHSLGGMSLLNSTKDGLKIKALVTIGSGDKVSDILADFVKRLEQKPSLATDLQLHFESKFVGRTMESYSAYMAAKEIQIPVLIVHDKQDVEVPVDCAIHIHKHLKNGKLLLTNDLGHRKILGDENVILETVNFIEKEIS